MENIARAENFRIAPVVERITAATTFLGITAGSALVAYFDPSTHQFFPLCPLFALTGLACPGCGLTRGFHALFHGDLARAFHFNALIPLWAVIISWVWLSLLLLAVRGRGLSMWPTKPRFLWVFFTLLLVFGVLRNIPVYPLSAMYP